MNGSAGGGRVALSVTAAQVRVLLTKAHRLDERAGEDAVCAVAGLSGVQDSPPGAAAMVLHARAGGITSAVLERALTVDRTLVRTWAMRGAPYVVPTADLSVFTTGVLPVDEKARTNLLVGVRQALDELSGGLDDYVAAAADAVREVLSGQRLEINELGREVAERMGSALPEHDRAAWKAEGPYAKGQPLGEGVVHFCIRILTLQQLLCFAPRQGRTAPFVLLSEWLDGVPQLTGEAARRELARRFLRAYGPSTPAGLARWLGVAASDAPAWWNLIRDDRVRVDVDGSHRWLLVEDLQTLQASRGGAITGVRLLPPRDPFLQLPHREVLVADRAQQRQLWRPLHSPGALLLDGAIAGTWRGRKKSSRLEITVAPFRPLPRTALTSIDDAAQALALARGAVNATVAVGGPS